MKEANCTHLSEIQVHLLSALCSVVCLHVCVYTYMYKIEPQSYVVCVCVFAIHIVESFTYKQAVKGTDVQPLDTRNVVVYLHAHIPPIHTTYMYMLYLPRICKCTMKSSFVIKQVLVCGVKILSKKDLFHLHVHVHLVQ